MKKTKIILTLFVFLLSISVKTQWVLIANLGNHELRGVKFFNELTGVIVGQGGVWKTTNSGINWEQSITGGNFYALSFPDFNTGYVVGENGMILKTIDNAYSWITQIGNTSNNLYSVNFYNVLTGHTVGQNGVILRTQNGGQNWYQNVSQLTEDLYSVHIVGPLTGFVAGSSNNEVFASTVNGGTNWVYTLNSPGNVLRSVFNVNSGNIIAVGSNGRVRRSTNYGATWYVILTGFSQVLNQVLFIDVNIGYIAGDAGLILQTTNGGNNWVSQSSPTSNNLKGISFINSEIGWAVGSNGIVLRTGIPIGIKINNGEMPKSFNLYQNYPNPFNPKTKIKFEIPISGNISLKVYNALGIEVETIINGFMQRGVYDVKWEAINKSSGIYFYRITFMNQELTRKMLLIK